MSIKLEKGQRISLEKDGGSKMQQFCVGCNWGAITQEKKGFLGIFNSTESRDVDLDLSCIIVDDKGNMIDYIYSPEYRKDFLAKYKLAEGKLTTQDKALHHSGDDRAGDKDGDDGLDNEIISVNLDKITPEAQQIFFFLNNVGQEDFSRIPYASIRMFEGTPEKVDNVFASYDVSSSPQYNGKRALIMGKLYKRDGNWRFQAIGDPTDDSNLCETIGTILKSYTK